MAKILKQALRTIFQKKSQKVPGRIDSSELRLLLNIHSTDHKNTYMFSK